MARTFYRALARDFGMGDLYRADIAQYIIDREGRPLAWEIAREKLRVPDSTPGLSLTFLAELPAVMRAHGRLSHAWQWILTTNYDTFCEQVLDAAGEPYHLLYYQADGPYLGLFFHRDPKGTVRLIEQPDFQAHVG